MASARCRRVPKSRTIVWPAVPGAAIRCSSRRLSFAWRVMVNTSRAVPVDAIAGTLALTALPLVRLSPLDADRSVPQLWLAPPPATSAAPVANMSVVPCTVAATVCPLPEGPFSPELCTEICRPVPVLNSTFGAVPTCRRSSSSAWIRTVLRPCRSTICWPASTDLNLGSRSPSSSSSSIFAANPGQSEPSNFAPLSVIWRTIARASGSPERCCHGRSSVTMSEEPSARVRTTESGTECRSVIEVGCTTRTGEATRTATGTLVPWAGFG